MNSDSGLVIIIQSAIFLGLDGYVLVSAFRKNDTGEKQHYFRWMAVTAFCLQLGGLAVRFDKSSLGAAGLGLQTFLFILIFTSMGFAGLFGFRYLMHLCGIRPGRAARVIMLVPAAVLAAASLISPLTHWVFFIDGDMQYHRGTLFFLQVACPYVYMAAAAVLFVFALRHRDGAIRARTVRNFLCYIIPSVLCTFLQVGLNIDGGYSTIGISLSTILLYLEFYMDEIRQAEHLRDLALINESLEKARLEAERARIEAESARREAEEANNAKTAFLFNMSHDIRTPMNAIIGFRDLLEKYQDDPARREDYLKKIESSSAVLLSLINNVLEMARIEKGTLELEEKPIDTEGFSEELYSTFRDMMAQKGITFSRQIRVQNPCLYGDPIKLREIFINLLSNAFKYTEPGGRVDMTVEEIPSERAGWAMYRTTVTDTGIGMSEEFLPHIFEEFARERNTTEARTEGTGLGMPIVKRLVDLMGGTIEVKSAKGEGSTFVVTLPHRIAENEAGGNGRRAETDPERIRGKKILLAEDNDLNAEIAEEILTEAGLSVDRAEDGEICVRKIRENPAGTYDLVLMDIQMPNMNGFEAARAIRALEDPDRASVRIFALTANAFEEDRREAIRAGMNGHLAKPINTGELMRAMAGILG